VKHQPIPFPRFAAQASDDGLVGHVLRLTDCLTQSNVLNNKGELYAHVEAAQDALNAAREAEIKHAEMARRIAELEQLSLTDELTGLLNRRGFLAEMKRALAQASRYDEHGVLVYVDLDGFKPVNDTHGHQAGDEVLKRVAEIMCANVRDTDYVGRLGGDEFAFLLVRTSWQSGLHKAETMERLLNSAFIDWLGQRVAIRASLGFQCYGPDDESQDLLNRADDAMYRTKKLRASLTAPAPVSRISAPSPARQVTARASA